MKKKLNVDKYDPKIYPRKLWITTEIDKLNEQFVFVNGIDNLENCSTYHEIQRDFEYGTSIALTCAVMNIATDELGVLIILMNKDKVTTEVIAHESVHVADYFYEQLGLYSQDFSSGNEAYAYLVGWSADCISNTLNKIRKQDD